MTPPGRGTSGGGIARIAGRSFSGWLLSAPKQRRGRFSAAFFGKILEGKINKKLVKMIFQIWKIMNKTDSTRSRKLIFNFLEWIGWTDIHHGWSIYYQF
jgi:hypothetical protein